MDFLALALYKLYYNVMADHLILIHHNILRTVFAVFSLNIAFE